MLPLDPTLAVALVNAAGGLLKTLLERLPWGDKRDTDKSAATVVMEKVYDDLRLQLTDNSVKVLLALEDGENRAPFQIVDKVLSGQHSEKLVHEFEYRLKFLCLLGLLTTVGGSEYAITKLGKAFLNVARDRGPYRSVLFKAS